MDGMERDIVFALRDVPGPRHAVTAVDVERTRVKADALEGDRVIACRVRTLPCAGRDGCHSRGGRGGHQRADSLSAHAKLLSAGFARVRDSAYPRDAAPSSTFPSSAARGRLASGGDRPAVAPAGEPQQCGGVHVASGYDAEVPIAHPGHD